MTALFGGQTRRELKCEANDAERSVGFDAFSSLTVPLYDSGDAGKMEETVDVRCRVRFARQRCWPVDVVATVSTDAKVLDVLEALCDLELSSEVLEHGPALTGGGNGNSEVKQKMFTDASNLVAMLPCLGPQPSANEKALDAAAHLLSPHARVREPALNVCHGPNCSHRLEIYEVPPLHDPARMPESRPGNSDCVDEEVRRSVHCTVSLRTLATVDHFFAEPFRLLFFGDPLVVRVVERETTGHDLYRIVWEQLKPFCNQVPEHDRAPFALRAFSPRGSDTERLAANTLAGSEMLLPDGGALLIDDARPVALAASDLDGVRFVADVPASARRRFNDRALHFVHVHKSCAPPPPKPPIALEACLKSYCAPETVTKYSKLETRKNGAFHRRPFSN